MKDLGEPFYILGIKIYEIDHRDCLALVEVHTMNKFSGVSVCMIPRRVSCLCHMMYTCPRDSALLHHVRGDA